MKIIFFHNFYRIIKIKLKKYNTLLANGSHVLHVEQTYIKGK